MLSLIQRFGRHSVSFDFVFSPAVLVPMLWLVAVASAQLHLFVIQERWSRSMWIVALAVPALFFLGGFLGWMVASYRLAEPTAEHQHNGMRSSTAFWILMASLLAVGYGELAYQFASAGHIPLFSGNIDLARVALPGGPTAVLSSALSVVVVAGLTRPPRLVSRAATPELALSSAALVGAALQGGRFPVVLPVATALVARAIVWGPPRLELLTVTVLGVAVLFSTAYYYRASQHPWTPFESELLHEVLPQVPWFLRPLVPLHIALATNLAALADLIDFFPSHLSFGHGIYTAAAFDSVLPQARHASAISATISPNFITSTFAGPLWADGGFPLVFLGAAAFGLISTLAYVYARMTRKRRFVLPASYLYVVALLGIYLNLFTDTADWILVIPLLFVVGILVDREHLQSNPTNTASNRRRPMAQGVVAIAALLVVADLTAAGAAALILRGPRAVFEATVQAPPGIAAAQLISDGDSFERKLVLWGSRSAGRTIEVSRLAFDFPDFWKRDTHSFSVEKVANLRKRPSSQRLDVASFRAGEKESLFAIASSESGLRMTVLGLFGQHRRTRYSVPVGPPAQGVARRIEISRWSGPITDLFVVDLGPGKRGVRVRVFSGETRYRKKLVDTRTRPWGLAAADIVIDVGRLGGSKPDLLIVSRHGQSGRLELHVVSGESRFHKFVLHTPTQIPASRTDRYRLVLASRDGKPAVAAFDSESATVTLLELPNLADTALAQRRRDLNR